MASRNLGFNTFTPRSPIGEGVRDFMNAMFAGQGGRGGGSTRSAAQDEADLAQAFMYGSKGKLDEQTYDARTGIAGRADELLRQRENSRTRPLNLDFAPGDDGLGFDLDTSALARMIRQPLPVAPPPDEPIVRPYLPNSDATPLSTSVALSKTSGLPEDWGVPPIFDPEGADYDYATARAAGLDVDATGHWPSRDPRTGVILKGRNHPTYALTEQGEREAGYVINQDPSGRYVSSPMPQPGLDLNALPPGLNLPDAMPEVVMSRGELGQVDPLEQERYITMLGIELAKAFGGNPDQIAGGMGELQTQGFERGLMSGDVTPEQWFLLNNKPLQDVQDGYAVPTTSMDEPNPLGTALARINTEEARQGEIGSRVPVNQARVRTEGARQTLYGQQAETQGTVRERNLAAAEKLRQPSAGAGGKPLVPKKFDVQTIDGEIAALLSAAHPDAVSENGVNIDATLNNRIKARAMELFAESGDHYDAAATAVEEVMGEIEVEGNQWWNPKTDKIVPKPGLGPRKPAPGAMRPPADKQKIDAAAALPPEAARKLKEGVSTKFGNGQTWTLQNGVPVRVY